MRQNDVYGHVDIIRQQFGHYFPEITAARNIAAGLCIMDQEGNIIKVDRTQPPHLVILIPELSLIAGREEVGIPFFQAVMQNTRGFLHILDPIELLRIVQAGSMIAARGRTTTPMMAFDNWLTRRAEHLVQVGHPYFHVLLRFDEEQADEQPEGQDSSDN
jgi:hypothetical protein